MKSLSVLCVCTLVVLSGSMTAEQKLKNCNDVRAAYSSKGFNVNDVPNKGVNASNTFPNLYLSAFPQRYPVLTRPLIIKDPKKVRFPSNIR
ncbi:hypothetical protein EYF80_024262 [Liparis tanakae]|uniref:Uncharacterized protein n=1 Tax=Liparis tanakae TaxID=230148 RepID=A0A4Z2HKX3_9TELE|nr:hypothetical protein EYF80_024262 [Liparis tanakae]